MTRCRGMTKTGMRCGRLVKPGSSFCRKHRRQGKSSRFASAVSSRTSRRRSRHSRRHLPYSYRAAYSYRPSYKADLMSWARAGYDAVGPYAQKVSNLYDEYAPQVQRAYDEYAPRVTSAARDAYGRVRSMF